MKKWKKAVLFTFVLLMFCGRVVASSAEEPAAKDVQRVNMAQEYINAAQEVAKKTAHPDALVLADFLVKNTAVCAPDAANQLWSEVVCIREAEGTQFSFCLVPLLEGESQWRKSEKEEGVVAVLNSFQGPAVMILRADIRLSDKWKGVVMLHAAYHIFSSFKYSSLARDIEGQALEDYHAFLLEQEWLNSLGGEPYAALVKKEATRLKKAEKKNGKIQYLDELLYSKELTDIFGEAASSQEELMRKTALWLEGAMQFVAEGGKNPEEKAALKTALVRLLLEQGIL